jgi:hypothetical protein
MPSRYLRIQKLRIDHAAAALVAVRERLRGTLKPSDPHAPYLYASHILEADDEDGGRSGYVVRGDAVTWDAIDSLYDLAVRGARAHAVESGHGRDPECPTCQQFNAIWAVPIAEPVRLRRGYRQATELLTPGPPIPAGPAAQPSARPGRPPAR